MITKKFSLVNDSNLEIGTVNLEHLWSDVYGLRIFRTKTYANPNQWSQAISEALNESKVIKAREVIFRLIKDDYSNEFHQCEPICQMEEWSWINC